MSQGNMKCDQRPRRPRHGLHRRFFSDRKGNVALAAAVSIAPLMIAAGLAIDVGNMSRTRSDIQAALDAANMQVALEYNSGRSDSELQTLGKNYFIASIQGNHDPERLVEWRYLGMTSDAPGIQTIATEASFDYVYAMPRLLEGEDGATSRRLRLVSEISSRMADGACIYALNHTAPRAIDASGSTLVEVEGCVIASNSNADDSIYVGGAASIHADCLQSSGGIAAGTGDVITACAQNRENAWRSPDPFAALVEPIPPILLQNPNRSDTVVQPGRYRNLSLNGTKTLEPGLYYVEGSLKIGGDITGEGVTIFMKDGAISVNGNATISISAPQEGDLAGMLLWAARGNTSSHKLNGNGATDLNGYLYFPSGSVEYSGNNGTTSNCLRIVADTITLTGSSMLRSDCRAELGGREARVAGPLYYSR
ncbi:MAG: pilus assembly protein [Rhizobiaceae bacterium]|nr:pilus assembly protein [Rhizobiaceae bacterium]MCV0406150.1 pilus assembly protein [Rhizobiaceae bacterium]